MKTSELIEIARRCVRADCGVCYYYDCDNCEKNPCKNCPFECDEITSCSDKLIIALADRLEKACKDMKFGIENVGCDVCAKEMPDGWCDVCEFEWRGDKE